jgi:hypothetical protein
MKTLLTVLVVFCGQPWLYFGHDEEFVKLRTQFANMVPIPWKPKVGDRGALPNLSFAVKKSIDDQNAIAEFEWHDREHPGGVGVSTVWLRTSIDLRMVNWKKIPTLQLFDVVGTET